MAHLNRRPAAWLLVTGVAAAAVARAPWGEVFVPVPLYLVILLGGVFTALALSVALRQPLGVGALVLAVWIVRLSVMAALKAYSASVGLGGFYPTDADSYYYHARGALAASSGDWIQSLQGQSTYLYIIAAIYRMLGVDLALPELVNLSLSVVVVPFLYHLASRISGARAAGWSVVLWALIPSGLLWSVSLMKDIWIVAGILLFALGLAGITRGAPAVWELASSAIGVVVIGFLRPPYLLIPVGALALTVLLRSEGRARIRYLVLATVMTVVAVAAIRSLGLDVLAHLTVELVRATSEEGVSRLSQFASAGATGIPFLARFPSSVRWIVQLPFSIFAPFPWQWGLMGSGLGRISAVEMAGLYALYFCLWRERRRMVATPEGKAVLLLMCLTFVAVSFSLPNIGSIYRYRWPAIVLLLVLAPFPHPDSNRRSPAGQHGRARSVTSGDATP